MRLFVAMLLDENVRSTLTRVQAKLAPSGDGARWIPAEQMHLTVKFLGEVPEDRVLG